MESLCRTEESNPAEVDATACRHAIHFSMSLPLPELLTCRLTIKSGVLFSCCRDKVPPIDFVFRVADGWRVLSAAVEEHFERALPGQWSADTDIYLRPSKHAPQKDFAKLCSAPDAFRAQVDAAWHKARLRKDGQAGFVMMLFVYVPKPTEQHATLRRATGARIRQQLPRVASFLREHGISSGGAAQAYMATTQAWLPEGSPLQVPDNTTFRQLQSIDSQQASIDAAATALQHASGAEYCVVRVRVQGVAVPIEINLADIRDALGLPSYSLRPPFRASVSTNTPDPDQGMEDIDHQERD